MENITNNVIISSFSMGRDFRSVLILNITQWSIEKEHA